MANVGGKSGGSMSPREAARFGGGDSAKHTKREWNQHTGHTVDSIFKSARHKEGLSLERLEEETEWLQAISTTMSQNPYAFDQLMSRDGQRIMRGIAEIIADTGLGKAVESLYPANNQTPQILNFLDFKKAHNDKEGEEARNPSQSRRGRHARAGMTLVEKLVVMAIISILVAILLPAVQMAREAGRQTQGKNSAKNILLAEMMFHDAHKHYPTFSRAHTPPMTSGSNAQAGLLGIADYIEGTNWANAHDPNQPNYSPANLANNANTPSIFKHPSINAGVEGEINFVFIGSDKQPIPMSAPVIFNSPSWNALVNDIDPVQYAAFRNDGVVNNAPGYVHMRDTGLVDYATGQTGSSQYATMANNTDGMSNTFVLGIASGKVMGVDASGNLIEDPSVARTGGNPAGQRATVANGFVKQAARAGSDPLAHSLGKFPMGNITLLGGADGSVHTVSADMALDVLKALTNGSDGKSQSLP